MCKPTADIARICRVSSDFHTVRVFLPASVLAAGAGFSYVNPLQFLILPWLTWKKSAKHVKRKVQKILIPWNSLEHVFPPIFPLLPGLSEKPWYASVKWQCSHTPPTEAFMSTIPVIPATGFLRLPQVLVFVPISKTAWWDGVNEGRFPRPVKLGKRTTAWKAEDIAALVERIGSQAD